MVRRKRRMWLIPIFFVIAILAVYMTLSLLPSGTFGTEWSTISTELWLYMPWLIMFALGLYTLFFLRGRSRRSALSREMGILVTIFICAILGITTAMILSTMNTRGFFIDEFVTGSITIDDVMFLAFFLWTIIGILISIEESG